MKHFLFRRIGHPSNADHFTVSSDLADVGDDLEREAEGQESGSSSPPIYRPREALRNALRDWLALMHQVSFSTFIL